MDPSMTIEVGKVTTFISPSFIPSFTHSYIHTHKYIYIYVYVYSRSLSPPFSGNASTLPVLNAAQMHKLKTLTLIAMASTNKVKQEVVCTFELPFSSFPHIHFFIQSSPISLSLFLFLFFRFIPLRFLNSIYLVCLLFCLRCSLTHLC